MAKAPRRRKVDKTAEASEQTVDLVAALEWCRVAQKDVGPPLETHCYIGLGFVAAFDGIIAAGHVANVQDVSAPHTFRMLNALHKTQGAVSIVHNENGDVSISAGRFKARIPTVAPDTLPPIMPDACIAVCNDELKRALGIVEGLTKEGAQTLHGSSVLLRANTVVGTDGISVLEAWHGIDLPTLVIPKGIANLVAKASKPLTGFGFGYNTATFWFGNDAWLRTQLYLEKWPDIDRAFATNSGQWTELPATFFEALAAIAPFSEDGFAHYYDGRLCSHAQSPDVGASYDVPLDTGEFSFNAKRMAAYDWAGWIAFDTLREKAFFEGKGFPGRGALALARDHARAMRAGAQTGAGPGLLSAPASPLPEIPPSPPMQAVAPAWGSPVVPVDPNPTGEFQPWQVAAASASVALDNDIPF